MQRLESALKYLGALGVSAILMATCVLTVSAQDASEPGERVEKKVEVIVDEEGNITVNGEPVDDLDDIEVHVENGTKVMVFEDDDGNRRVIKRRSYSPGSTARHHVWNFPHEALEFHGMPFEDMQDIEVEVMGDGKRVIVRGDDDLVWMSEGLPHLEFFDEEVMDNEREARKLAREARKVSGEERKQLEQALRDKLDAIFDLKLEKRAERTRELEERLAREQERLEQRRRSREAIIDRRQSELLGDDDLEW
jgi:hypothetical protein